jgi:hypothetical protein
VTGQKNQSDHKEMRLMTNPQVVAPPGLKISEEEEAVQLIYLEEPSRLKKPVDEP